MACMHGQVATPLTPGIYRGHAEYMYIYIYIYMYKHQEYYYLRFRDVFWFFNVFLMFYAADGTWEARASSKHTNLTRRIDPPTPKYLKSPKLKKSGFPQIIFSDPFVIWLPFPMFLFWKSWSHMAPQAKPLCGNESYMDSLVLTSDPPKAF